MIVGDSNSLSGGDMLNYWALYLKKLSSCVNDNFKSNINSLTLSQRQVLTILLQNVSEKRRPKSCSTYSFPSAIQALNHISLIHTKIKSLNDKLSLFHGHNNILCQQSPLKSFCKQVYITKWSIIKYSNEHHFEIDHMTRANLVNNEPAIATTMSSFLGAIITAASTPFAHNFSQCQRFQCNHNCNRK